MMTVIDDSYFIIFQMRKNVSYLWKQNVSFTPLNRAVTLVRTGYSESTQPVATHGITVRIPLRPKKHLPHRPPL